MVKFNQDYWKECISIAADECDLSLTKEQLDYLASSVEGGHDNYGMAFYSPRPVIGSMICAVNTKNGICNFKKNLINTGEIPRKPSSVLSKLAKDIKFLSRATGMYLFMAVERCKYNKTD